MHRQDPKFMESLASRLPQSDHQNTITSSLRGILSKHKPREEQTQEIQSFLKQNFNQNHEHQHSQGRYNQTILDNFSREEKMMNNMKNAGLAFEFFLVDALKRSTYTYRGVDINHEKASPYLDHKRKIDYLSQIKQKNKPDRNIGIQLTTQQSGAKIFPKSYHKEMKKKRKVVKELSDIIYKDTEIQSYEDRNIDMTAYMVVNGHINQRINKEKDNVFLAAFKKRKEEGFPGGGPIKYLPKTTKQDIGKIWLTYHLSLLDFIKFIHKIQGNKELLDKPIQDMYTHRNDAYIITKTYVPESRELTHHVFIDHNKTENLLFSLSYFLNKQAKA